jgi:predicted small lipoprotein YifL
MKFTKTIVSLFAAVLLVAGLAACEKKGPAETAGEKIDQTTEKAGQKMEEVGNSIQRSADDAKK